MHKYLHIQTDKHATHRHAKMHIRIHNHTHAHTHTHTHMDPYHSLGHSVDVDSIALKD